MKMTHMLLSALAPALVAGSAQAVAVTWGTVQTITGASDIQTTGLTGVAGADFGITTGTTTIVNNGTDDVEFLSLRSGQNVTLSNGINVEAEATWINFGTAGGNSNITGNFGLVLDRNLGIEEGNPADADITLSNLTIGKQYQIQLFVSDLRTAANFFNQTVTSGNVSDPMTTDNGVNGTFIIGTFTADATTQILTITGTGPDGVALTNALTIGEIAGPAFDPADLDQDGDVDDADFGIAFAAFTGPGGVSASPADLDDDGDVDDADFGIAFAAFTGPGGGAAVPEPTSLALLGLGGLLIARRRRA